MSSIQDLEQRLAAICPYVEKRDGSLVPFNAEKITLAVYKAGIATGDYDDLALSQEITRAVITTLLVKFNGERQVGNFPNIEQIQDLVIENLELQFPRTARSYRLYREERAIKRRTVTEATLELIDRYIEGDDWRIRENSNTEFSLQGANNLIVTNASNQYWMHKVYPSEIRNAHTSGDIHIHDAGLLAPYCMGWDLKDLLMVGFKGVPNKPRSAPAKHFSSALGQIWNFLYTLQGEAAGAMALSSVDTLLAPFIRKDRLTFDQIKQHMQAFMFNMNTSTRVGFQCVPDSYECLTPNGWKRRDQLQLGEDIYVLNMSSQTIGTDRLVRINEYEYEGAMVRFSGEALDIIVTPEHRVLYYDFDEEQLCLEEASYLAQRDDLTDIPVPQFEAEGHPVYRKKNLTLRTGKRFYRGKVWCPTTLSGTFICRNEHGQVFITGNCPFTNLTMDLKVPTHMAREAVIIGGELQDSTYGEYQDEVDIFNQAFAEVMLEGDADGRLFSFPIPTYSIVPGFDWDNPKLEPIWRMAGKYGIPYFTNYLSSGMNPEDIRAMCCRLLLDNRELRKRGGGLFGSAPLTGSIGVVSLNMPRIGYLARQDSLRWYYELLDKRMDLAKDSLLIKRQFLEGLTDRGFYPFSKYYLRDIKARSGQYWANHFNTIGLIGMNESCLNLFGEGIGTSRGKEFAEEVLDHMRVRLARYQEETGIMFNLEATPGEGLSYRFAMLDQKRYPEIITAATGKVKEPSLPGEEQPEPLQPYYTNSTHLPVDYTQDLFAALDHQNSLQTKYTGGTIFHTLIGEEISDPVTVKNLIRTIMENYRVPYVSLTPTFSICPQHAYLKGEQPVCPDCGSQTEVYTRIVGYYRPVSAWNKGKQAEKMMRLEYVPLESMAPSVPTPEPDESSQLSPAASCVDV